MAVIKVSTSEGIKELKCFDTLDDVPYLEDDVLLESDEEVEDDTVGF